MDEFAQACQAAARLGGDILREKRGSFSVREKGRADLVTEADIASQTAIRDYLLAKFPDHGFVGEERLDDDPPLDDDKEFTWVVDPLDGTTNYVHGLENYCVSVALQQGNEAVVGAVYNPNRDHCYWARQGGGAFCNESPIRVSEVSAIEEALIAASFPPVVARDSVEVELFLTISEHCQAMRRLGSAALNLCYVAHGMLDAYWATCVNKWDVAAGLLLVQEAGGTVSQLDGSPLDLERPRFVASAGQALHAQLIPLLSHQA